VEEHSHNLQIFLKGCEKAFDELVNKTFWMSQAVWPRGRRKLCVPHVVPLLWNIIFPSSRLWSCRQHIYGRQACSSDQIISLC